MIEPATDRRPSPPSAQDDLGALAARRLVALYEAATPSERARLAMELARRGLHY